MKKRWITKTQQRGSIHLRLIGLYLTPVGLLAGYTRFQWERIDLEAIALFLVATSGVLALIRLTRHLERKAAMLAVEIDYEAGEAIFHHYCFITRFSGDMAVPIQRVPMSGIYKVRHYRNGNHEHLDLTTERGVVTLSNLDGMDDVREAFSQIVKINERANPEFRQRVEAAPKPRTPWYGWAILLGFVGLVILVGWLTLYSP